MVHLAKTIGCTLKHSILVLLLFLPFTVCAQVERGLIEVGAPFNPLLGGGEVGGIVAFIMGSLKPFVNGVAFFLIIGYGTMLVLRQESEDQLSKTRTTVLSALIAIILINLAEPIWEAYINFTSGGEQVIYRELIGFISWIEEIVLLGAIILIIGNGIRTVANYGSDEGLALMRRTIFSILFGIILLSVKFILTESLAITFRPDGVIESFVYVFDIILGVMALIAVVVVIYAGFLMVANVGNDEQYTRARGILIRVAIGLVVILTAGALINAFLVAAGVTSGFLPI
jgi:hypothetical protein